MSGSLKVRDTRPLTLVETTPEDGHTVGWDLVQFRTNDGRHAGQVVSLSPTAALVIFANVLIWTL